MRNIFVNVIIAVFLLVILVPVVNRTHAQDFYYRGDLADRLAVRFNLNVGEVRDYLIQYSLDIQSIRYSDSQSGHLTFIESKLAKGVGDRWISQTQKLAIMTKLREMIDQGPSPASWRAMSETERNERINNWRQEMRAWARKHGTSLDLIRNLTGKGNKYLMGMEF